MANDTTRECTACGGDGFYGERRPQRQCGVCHGSGRIEQFNHKLAAAMDRLISDLKKINAEVK